MRSLSMVFAVLVGLLALGFAETGHAETIRFLSQEPNTVWNIDNGYISDTVVPGLHFSPWDAAVFDGWEADVVGCELVNDLAGTSDVIYTNPGDQPSPGTTLVDIVQTGVTYGSHAYDVFEATVETTAVPEPSTWLLATLAIGMLLLRRKW